MARKIIFINRYFSGLKIVPQTVTLTTSLPALLWGIHLLGMIPISGLKTLTER